MPIHIIIDGYNLIRQSQTFSMIEMQDIQLGREALIDALAEYRKVKRHRITVVFDGTSAAGLGRYRDRAKGVEILFSRGGETADAVIKKMAATEGEKALVVSSDRDVVDFSASAGAATISSPRFENKLARNTPMLATFPDRDDEAGWIPTTKKKGPRRKLSKKERRFRRKINKL
jgi:predicted RNA-binding protein with PIN domain